jgi:cobalt-zinc-cadmium efflux system protein
MALLADAGHNLGDVAGLLLSLVGFRVSQVVANKAFTYGYRKATVLAALFNAVFLLVAVGAIGYEAILRLWHPAPIPGGTVIWVGALGIVINGASALLFFRRKDADLNVRGAFLHLLTDALVSLGVVVSGFVILQTDGWWIDSAVSLVISAVILWGTVGMFRDSLRLALDGVPPGVDVAQIQASVRALPGVVDFHHIHVWAMSTTRNALTAHLVVSSNPIWTDVEALKAEVRHTLLHENIHHSTLEVHAQPDPCPEADC